MKTSTVLSRLLIVSALSLAVSGVVQAAPATNAAQPACPAMQAGQSMPGMRGFARLHDELKLEAKQEALWQEALKSSSEAMTAMRERARQQHEELKAKMNQPGADLRALFKQMDEFHAEQQKTHIATRDRWLGVYDSLNADQKEKARFFFASGMNHFGPMGMMHGQRSRGGHGHGHDHGWQRGPMPAPAQPTQK